MKILLTLIGAAVLATGAWAGTSLVDDSEPGRTVSVPGATTVETTTAGTTTGTTTTDEADDISGPCDEAEHANDPRCTGAAGVQADDDDGDDGHGRTRGHGDGGDDDGHEDDHDDDDEDRSGSNSGRG